MGRRPLSSTARGRPNDWSCRAGARYLYVAFNTKKGGAMANPKVRQAIAWSIDRERFCRTVLQGLSEPTCLIWPPQSWAYFKDLQGKIGYDLDKARALLKEAGYEKGFDAEILTASKRGFGYGDLAVMLQADLRKIGINAKVIATVADAIKAHCPNAFVIAWIPQ